MSAYADIFPAEAPPPTLEELTRHWADAMARGSTAFVAEERGEMVGVVLAGPDPAEAIRGQLSRLYVDPDIWGRGIGRALYDACIDELVVRRFHEATLWVLERNGRVRAWYERLGWRLTGERRPIYAPAGIDDVLYHRTLEDFFTLSG